MHRIALIGGGPAALFMYKAIVEKQSGELEVMIFEKNDTLGKGFPYSTIGSAEEHITNVSDNEIPTIITHVKEWADTAAQETLEPFNLEEAAINEYKVLPRLLFGEYLAAQFALVQKMAVKKGIVTKVFTNTTVKDLEVLKEKNVVKVIVDSDEIYYSNEAIICTGHSWPKKHEEDIIGWYDSPYPPQKIAQRLNWPVAIAGASLTAIDAVRTLARANGSFSKNNDGTYKYSINEENKDFKIVLHSLHGLLPALRFHLQDTHLTPVPLLTQEQVQVLKENNDGYVPLDYIFDRHFMQVLKEKDSQEFEKIKDKSLEEVIEYYLSFRENLDPFVLLKAEYAEAEKSIKHRHSVMWKETLGALSYALNYPAKHFSAEDMLRLKKVLMPLVAVVIAYVPQSSCRELMALYDAGALTLRDVNRTDVAVPLPDGGATYIYKQDDGTEIKEDFKTYINAIGQAPVLFNDFPFASIKNEGEVSTAYLYFKDEAAAQEEMSNGNKDVSKTESGLYRLQLPGVQINDYFQALNRYGEASSNIFIMAVPLIAGINPDYSGLDFCEVAAKRIAGVLKF